MITKSADVIVLRDAQAKNLPRLTWNDVLTGELPEADQAKLNAYFATFVKPQKNDAGKELCVGCGHIIRSGIEAWMLGGAPDSCSMKWGLVHGECRCTNCGWPARAYHFNIPKDNPIITRLDVVLQYHPDDLSSDKSEAAA